MRNSLAVIIVAMFCSSSAVCAVQSPANGTPAQNISPAPLPPSGLLQPSLDTVQQTMGALRLEKWKRGDIRDGANANITSIQRDLQTTLPPLLREADAAPGTISKVLPLYRNIDALYDVVLRVLEASRVTAPVEQITQLQQALTGLGDARRALDDHLQGSAAALEKQVSDLRSTLQAQSATRCPVPPAPVTPKCAPPAPVRKPKKKIKPPAATTPPTSPAPATGTAKP